MGCCQEKDAGKPLDYSKASNAPPAGAQLPSHDPDDPVPLAQADNKSKIIAQRGPYKIQLEAGITVYYCVCGRSTRQPFCDNKHQGTPFSALPYAPSSSALVPLCGCKATKTEPLCDGSHTKLQW